MRLPRLRDLLRGRRAGYITYDSPEMNELSRATQNDRAKEQQRQHKAQLRQPHQHHGPMGG